MRILLALLLAAHGLAHLVSFVEAWRLLPRVMPYKTTVLAGHVDLGDTGTRAAGVLWLLVSIAFAVVAGGAAADTDWWVAGAFGTAVVSLVLSATEWPEARVGVMIDVAILAALPLGRWLGFI